MSDLTDKTRPLTSEIPHLLPAFHAWLVENDFTPYVQALLKYPGMVVPGNIQQHNSTLVATTAGALLVGAPSVILNLAYRATRDLSFGAEGIGFNARFNGRPHQLFIPWGAITSLRAQERPDVAYMPDQTHLVTGEGQPAAETPPPEDPKPKRSHLQVVK